MHTLRELLCRSMVFQATGDALGECAGAIHVPETHLLKRRVTPLVSVATGHPSHTQVLLESPLQYTLQKPHALSKVYHGEVMNG